MWFDRFSTSVLWELIEISKITRKVWLKIMWNTRILDAPDAHGKNEGKRRSAIIFYILQVLTVTCEKKKTVNGHNYRHQKTIGRIKVDLSINNEIH